MMMLKTSTLFIFLLCSLISFSQVPQYVPTDGLVGYWGFNGNANDESGNNNNGLTSNTVLTSDRFGNSNSAYQFNGLSSRIDINSNFFNIGWNAFTISCWTYSTSFVNSGSYNDSQIVLNTSPHNGIAISMYGRNNPFSNSWTDKYVFLAGSQPNQRYWDVILQNGNSNVNRTINTWNHLVLIKDDNLYKFYINGVLDKTVLGSNVVNSYLCKIVLGALAPNIPAEVFLGKLDDYGIWNRALNQTEIANLNNSGTCPALLALESPIDDISAGVYSKIASRTNGKIIATNKIIGIAKLTFNAQTIELNAGFKVSGGAVFTAEPGGCN